MELFYSANSALVILIGTILVLLLLVNKYIRNTKTVDLRITRIYVHPIKSCKGTSVSSSEYTPQGLRYDRCLQIVDRGTHRMITARDIPKLVLVHPQIAHEGDPMYGGILRIQFPGDAGIEEVKTALEPKPELLDKWTRLHDVQIWSSVTDGYICQSIDGTMDPSAALSKYIGKEVLLVYKGPTIRAVGPTETFPDLKASAAFQDGYPILVACEESLVDVQEKVSLSASGVEKWSIKGVAGEWSGELMMERFRPNVVLEGSGKPYAEEEWQEINFSRGDASPYGRMMLVSRCTRCLLPNIEPTTGIQNPHVPYKVLAKYRRVDPSKPYHPCFGVNSVPEESGVYHVGDRVRVDRYAATGKLPAKEKEVKAAA